LTDVKIKSPCLNCPNRKVTETYNCHSVCEEYLAFRAKKLKEYDSNRYDQELAYLREVNDKIKKQQMRKRKR